MIRLNDLKCIKVIHTNVDGEITENYITYKRYCKSFIDERWSGERRYNKSFSVFGLNPTYITVNNGYGGISRRRFIFPNSVEEAREIHEKQANQ